MDYFEQIDDYLNSRLSADQEALFEQELNNNEALAKAVDCLLYTSPSPRDRTRSRMPSSA